jgi:hypothetical protein
MNAVGFLIGISLVLLLILGVAALFLAGNRSRDGNDADPPAGPPRGR